MQSSELNEYLKIARDFLSYSLRRFSADGCLRTATALSYSTLLALVPILAVVMTMISAFPAFSVLKRRIQLMIYENVLPDVGIEISDQLNLFVRNATETTGIGVLVLALTAGLLLNTITTAFNQIWRVKTSRPLLTRALVFWALLTLAPLVFGASFSLSAYLFTFVTASGLLPGESALLILGRVLSILLLALGFTLLYMIVPNRQVRFRHAVAGGLVAAALFEMLRRGFALYLIHFPSYQAVYGALAALPIFLVWMYLSWAVLLFGAEVAAAVPEFRSTRLRAERGGSPGSRLAIVLSILARLREAAREGRPLRESKLTEGLPVMLSELDDTLWQLARQRYIVRTSGHRWSLSRDLSQLTLGDLLHDLDLLFEIEPVWPAAAAVTGLAQRFRDSVNRPLPEVLDTLPSPQR